LFRAGMGSTPGEYCESFLRDAYLGALR
jgi:hypothetical protein